MKTEYKDFELTYDERHEGRDRAMTKIADYDRPSRHGAVLGAALAAVSVEGRLHAPEPIPPCCLTCAFRLGTMPNQCSGTLSSALDCVLGSKDVFVCHHGMREGEPTSICMGYVAAKLAPRAFTKEQLLAVVEQLDRIRETDPDHVREAFDAWVATIDPEQKLDVYQLGRAYERHREEQHVYLGGDAK